MGSKSIKTKVSVWLNNLVNSKRSDKSKHIDSQINGIKETEHSSGSQKVSFDQIRVRFKKSKRSIDVKPRPKSCFEPLKPDEKEEIKLSTGSTNSGLSYDSFKRIHKRHSGIESEDFEPYSPIPNQSDEDLEYLKQRIRLSSNFDAMLDEGFDLNVPEESNPRVKKELTLYISLTPVVANF